MISTLSAMYKVRVLMQEQAATRLQASVSELQRELDTERNLVLETQRSLATTQVQHLSESASTLLPLGLGVFFWCDFHP